MDTPTKLIQTFNGAIKLIIIKKSQFKLNQRADLNINTFL